MLKSLNIRARSAEARTRSGAAKDSCRHWCRSTDWPQPKNACALRPDPALLITGESGTGKELVARAIHNLGGRSATPFVAVSCGAIPETLIEAELFGHEKGAFTGATGPRQGLLEMAGQGTLFLDEIGELSLNTQVKLLRVLQQREFTRLGAHRAIPLKARVLYATHRDLNRMINEGSFRRDLLFRINVINIPVPALRDRPEDIPSLVRHFLQIYCASCRKAVTTVDPQAMSALMSHEWPGNVRELENIIHRAIIVDRNNQIGIEDLPKQLQDLRDSGPLPISIDRRAVARHSEPEHRRGSRVTASSPTSAFREPFPGPRAVK